MNGAEREGGDIAVADMIRRSTEPSFLSGQFKWRRFYRKRGGAGVIIHAIYAPQLKLKFFQVTEDVNRTATGNLPVPVLFAGIQRSRPFGFGQLRGQLYVGGISRRALTPTKTITRNSLEMALSHHGTSALICVDKA
ncbi:hypothetical protein FQR65_LT14217 [Abscondita terminalis]|nr:hypothetical protein FQR65_LT14217 [Abscondita terminalis]